MTYLSKKDNKFKIYNKHLFKEEKMLCTYKLLTDVICFTDKRILYFDRKFLSSKIKKTVIPYKSIETYTIITGGLWKRKNKVIIKCSNNNFEFEIKNKINIVELDKLLSKLICSHTGKG